jgi:CubicO group peptidase (beta-lactamase class C family)
MPGVNRVTTEGVFRLVLQAALLVACAAVVHPADVKLRGLPMSAPEAIGLSGTHLRHIESAVKAAMDAGEVPGAVVLVARRGRIGYLKAFGSRAVEPVQEAMTADTIFDMASLTKVMATAPAIMHLVERGEIRLDDKVKRYLPKFTGAGKDAVTVRQLLVHYSGLRPDFDLHKFWEGYPAAIEELWLESTSSDPGKDFVYSDLNFIALGEIVRVVSGKSLDIYALETIYRPLGMADTGFNPPSAALKRVAPTESRNRSLEYLKGEPLPGVFNEVIRGVVHDPTAWRMRGVAGHAGLFSTARDTARYAQMLLNRGRYGGRRILAPLTVEAMTSPQSPRPALLLRGYGWDIDTAYSSPRGDIFSGGFGHTGFTGTSLWIHPPTSTFVVLLTNRLHPQGSGDATHLRGAVANVVAASIVDVPR